MQLRVAENSKTEETFETINCRNYSNYDPENLRNDLKQKSFDAVYAETNPNTAWNQLKSILL